MHKESIDLLNEGIADELAAIHQYMYFHFHCDDQGYTLLAELFKRQAIDEMMHAEKLAERILFLGGDVEMVANQKVQKIHEAPAMLARAKSMEEAAVKMYNASARKCADAGDRGTMKIFEELIADEEGHFDSFQTQEDHLKKFGEQYLALQGFDGSKQAATPGGAEG